MQLADIVQKQIRRFAVGIVSADDLSDWLSVHAQAVHDSGDADLRRLTDFAFSLVEDVFQEHRQEEEAQKILWNVLPTTETVTVLQRELSTATAYSASGTVGTVQPPTQFTPVWTTNIGEAVQAS
jgi:hypothetical protein